MVRLTVDQLEADGLVDLARTRGRRWSKLRAPVAYRSRVGDAFLHQAAADAAAADIGLDVEKP
jgi:hypothetical protein